MPEDSPSTNINTKGIKQNSFDAIVIGSGISEEGPPRELVKKGLKRRYLKGGGMVRL